MANTRRNWFDEVVQYPNRYTETTDAEGKVTHTPAPGETIQVGTPQSATNFNGIEDDLQHYAMAWDWMYTIYQAEKRESERRIAALEAALEALAET